MFSMISLLLLFNDIIVEAQGRSQDLWKHLRWKAFQQQIAAFNR